MFIRQLIPALVAVVWLGVFPLSTPAQPTQPASVGTGTIQGVSMKMGVGSGNFTAATRPTTLPALSGERCFISLKALAQQAGDALAAKRPLSAETLNLAGIGRLEGFIAEPGNHDVILFGRKDPPWPALRLDDLATHLRNVWTGQPAPFCSLDLRPENLKKVQAVIAARPAEPSAAQMRQFTLKMQEALGPLEVVIGGVDRDCLAAHAMIDADYAMKKLSLGQERVAGVSSQLDRMAEHIRQAVTNGEAAQAVMGTYSRFYFHIGPGEPLFVRSDDAVYLSKCSLVVSTEQQWVQAGQQPAPGAQEALAREFASEFTAHFEQAAQGSADYARLDNLFRLSALLRAMRYLGVDQQAGLDLTFLLTRYPCQTDNKMPDTLPGLVGDKIVSVTARDNALVTYTLHPLVAGGVSMAMPMAQGQFDKTAMALLAPLVTSARAGRGEAVGLWWVGK